MATQQIPQIPVQNRPALGTRATVRLRQGGQLPAVIYGHGQDPVHVAVDAKAMSDLLQHHARLIEAVTDGQGQACLVKDVQWDHLGSQIIHVDLARVDLDESVTVEVGLEFVGEPKGIKEAGAFMEHPTTAIEVECRAGNIPESIRVDVSGLAVGDTLTVEDLTLPEGVKAVSDPDTVVAAIHVAVEEEEAVPEAAEGEAATAEPEVIGRKPGEEGEEKEED
jgi:large subunit ribosomal protein L25